MKKESRDGAKIHWRCAMIVVVMLTGGKGLIRIGGVLVLVCSGAEEGKKEQSGV